MHMLIAYTCVPDHQIKNCQLNFNGEIAIIKCRQYKALYSIREKGGRERGEIERERLNDKSYYL